LSENLPTTALYFTDLRFSGIGSGSFIRVTVNTHGKKFPSWGIRVYLLSKTEAQSKIK
jgi:hypothetical protein